MKKIPVIIFVLAAVLMAACSSDEQFRVSGSVEGNPTMNMRAGYYADGALVLSSDVKGLLFR